MKSSIVNLNTVSIKSKIKRRNVQNACMWRKYVTHVSERMRNGLYFRYLNLSQECIHFFWQICSLLLSYRCCTQMRWKFDRFYIWKIYALITLLSLLYRNEMVNDTYRINMLIILQIGHCFVTLVCIHYSLITLANALDSLEFQSMIKEVMHEREDCLLTKRNITLKMNSKVAKIFYESQSVSGMMLAIILCLV